MNFSKRVVLNLISEGSVLDIGCGDGLLLERLQNKGLSVSGVDISSRAIALCRERGLDCHQRDITDALPYPDNSFDHVLLIDVLEHLFQPLDTLREAQRISRTRVYISVPNFVSLPARLQVLRGCVPENNTPHDGHVYWMTLSAIRSLCVAAGLNIERITTNTIWENIPVVGVLTTRLKTWWPSLFALSFIIEARPFPKDG